jgi:hypothetical protein
VQGATKLEIASKQQISIHVTSLLFVRHTLRDEQSILTVAGYTIQCMELNSSPRIMYSTTEWANPLSGSRELGSTDSFHRYLTRSLRSRRYVAKFETPAPTMIIFMVLFRTVGSWERLQGKRVITTRCCKKPWKLCAIKVGQSKPIDQQLNIMKRKSFTGNAEYFPAAL